MATTAEKQRFGSGKGQQRAARVYQRPMRQISFGGEMFSFVAHRGAPWQPMPIDKLITTASWQELEGDAVLRGSITLSIPEEVGRLDLGLGHRIECRVRLTGGRRYRRLWMMRVTSSEATVGEGRTLTLASDLDLISRTKDDFKYRKGKHRRKKGWRCDQIARDICKDQRIRVKRLVKGRHYLTRFQKMDTSPLEAIREAYDKEATETGRRFFVSYDTGGLVVDTFRESPDMLILGKTILSARISKSLREGFCTAVTVQGTVGKGRKKEKVSVYVENERGIERYGYVHKIVKVDDLKSEAHARRCGRRELAKKRQPTREVSFSHPGLPWLHKFDALRIYLPEENFHEICWVKAVTHSLSMGSYEVQVDVAFSDPHYDARKARAAKKRKEAAARRNRRGAHSAADRTPKPKKARQRG